jgi:threonine dehydratase
MTDIEAINAASERLAGHARRTPLLNNPLLDDWLGRRVLVKAECLQHSGSFKYRGAFNAISALPLAARQAGVIAYSSGNHAQGMALAARQLGVPAVIVMPHDAPAIKLDNTRKLGAEVVIYQRGKESREALGESLAQERGLTLVKPYDDPNVIAGQGTVGLEIAQQAEALDITEAQILVCCGGGGLTAGIATAAASVMPGASVFPVEPEGFDDVARSLAVGERQRNESEQGLCDAVLTPTPGVITFPILQRHCKQGFLVSDRDVLRAMHAAFRYLKIVVEPGGAVALAAALFSDRVETEQPLIAVASGGNVDRAVFQRALDTPLD